MKSGEKLPALFVNVLTDPPIKLHHILDSRAVVYNCQFQCHLMHFSLVRVKVSVGTLISMPKYLHITYYNAGFYLILQCCWAFTV